MFIANILISFNALMTYILDGILLSIVPSGIFLLIIFALRPNIKISNKIAKGDDGRYVIKIVNRSHFKLYDVRFELQIKHPYGADGGKNVRFTNVNLKHDHKLVLENRPIFESKSPYFEHALLITINEDLIKRWENEADTLVFTVIAKHGLSSFSKIIKHKYTHVKSDIVSGKFKYGMTFEISKDS